jgi:hypothetical protein
MVRKQGPLYAFCVRLTLGTRESVESGTRHPNKAVNIKSTSIRLPLRDLKSAEQRGPRLEVSRDKGNLLNLFEEIQDHLQHSGTQESSLNFKKSAFKLREILIPRPEWTIAAPTASGSRPAAAAQRDTVNVIAWIHLALPRSQAKVRISHRATLTRPSGTG